ncbi:hypothetical protein [Halobaculum sp. MBLA0143]|uniref:hypothetical protein n=1 Tax=Halobaculum sp. MBLA0143 TaxID=3079933 RepID=UPI0035257289
MSERMEELQELADSDLPDETDEEASTGSDETAETSGGGLRDRLPGRPSLSGSLFAPRRFLLALGLAVAGLVVGGAIPFVGVVTRYVGLFAAAFGYGLVTDDGAYAEVGVAGAVAAAVTLVFGTLTTGGFVLGADLIGRYGITLTGVGVGIGLLVSLVGHYFGRDLRAGLTQDI